MSVDGTTSGNTAKRSQNDPVVDPGRIRILVVDDMLTNRANTRLILAGRNYTILEAGNGVEALEFARQYRPHLVLLDIVMPEMDGIACCRELKKDVELQDIKVIMVTSAGEYEQIAEAFRAGCDDYITKPINREELREKVEELSNYALCRQRLRTFIKNHSAGSSLR